MKRVQIHLEHQSLEELVTQMAEAVDQALLELDGVRGTSKDLRVESARKAIRRILEMHVHAYDTCGLASVCQEGTEVDPWDAKGQDED
jgi:hypothetical protein